MNATEFDKPFADRLSEAVIARGNPVLVGLDPRADLLPEPIKPDSTNAESLALAYREFCYGVIDVVAPLVPAVKPQAAFFEQLGPCGMQSLGDVVRYARQAGLIVILDGKRNDIGSTAIAYAQGYLGEASGWQCDALTVSPYLGADSLEPFFEVAESRNCGVFVLVKTSNPGGGLFQDLQTDGKQVFEHVADFVEQQSALRIGDCGYGGVGAVIGATYPQQLSQLRKTMSRTWFLIPGFGAQGGSAKDVAGAFDPHGLGAIINSSRGIIFAHRREPYQDSFGDDQWQDAVQAATKSMIAELAEQTPSSALQVK